MVCQTRAQPEQKGGIRKEITVIRPCPLGPCDESSLAFPCPHCFPSFPLRSSGHHTALGPRPVSSYPGEKQFRKTGLALSFFPAIYDFIITQSGFGDHCILRQRVHHAVLTGAGGGCLRNSSEDFGRVQLERAAVWINKKPSIIFHGML